MFTDFLNYQGSLKYLDLKYGDKKPENPEPENPEPENPEPENPEPEVSEKPKSNQLFYSCDSETILSVNDPMPIKDAKGESCSLISNTYSSGTGVLNFDKDIAIIEGRIFSNESLTKINQIVFPTGLTKIKGSVFSGCSGLTSVTIPESVTSIGDNVFYYCTGLTSITIPNSVTSIGVGTFGSCTGLTSVTIPNSVTSIGNSAFYGCRGLTSVIIGNSVKSIGAEAFEGCSSISSILIPNSVENINKLAFSGCAKMVVTMEALTPPAIGTEAFKDVLQIKVPAASLDVYKAAANWVNYADKMEGYESAD